MGLGNRSSSIFVFYKLDNFLKRNFQWVTFLVRESFPLAITPVPLLLIAPLSYWEMFMKPSFRAPERNEDVRSCLRSPCGWQMRGNCIWARTANSDPSKIQIQLWCLTAQKLQGNTLYSLILKIPSQNIQVSLTFLWQRPWKIWDGPVHFFWRRTQKCVGPSHLQNLFNSQQYSDFSPTKQLTNIPEQVQALSPATGR